MARRVIANHFADFHLGFYTNGSISVTIHLERGHGQYIAYIEDGVLYIEEYITDSTTVVRHAATNYYITTED